MPCWTRPAASWSYVREGASLPFGWRRPKRQPPIAELIATLEAAFRELGEGRAAVPPKGGIHPAPDAFIHAMPAYVPQSGAAGMKWVSAFRITAHVS